MEFAEVVRKRRMVRNFTDKPVAAEEVARLLDLARRAPSAGYTQGQSFVVVTRPDLRRAIAELCGETYYVDRGFDPFLSAAPVLVVACTSEAAYHRRYQESDKLDEEGREIDWPVPYWYVDAGAAAAGRRRRGAGGGVRRRGRPHRAAGAARDPGRGGPDRHHPDRAPRPGRALALAQARSQAGGGGRPLGGLVAARRVGPVDGDGLTRRMLAVLVSSIMDRPRHLPALSQETLGVLWDWPGRVVLG